MPVPELDGMEIESAVADSPQACMLEQVTNGLAIRMTLLYLMMAGTQPEEAQAAEAGSRN